MKLITLFFVGFYFLKVESQRCDSKNQIFFQGACVNSYCLLKAQQQANFQIVDFTNATLLKQLNGRITGQVMSIQKGQWLIDFQFGDRQLFNRLLYEDGVDCLDFRIYLNSNQYTVDSSRLLVTEYGTIPSWPQSFYQWNTRYKIGEVFFYLNESYFENNKECLKFTSLNITTYDCFFELAILLRHITVYSYYASIRYETQIINDTSQTSTLRFTQLVKSPQCLNSSLYNCSTSIIVNSTVLFCENQICANTSITPFGSIYQNKRFFIKHIITDSIYMNEYIVQPQIVFQSLGLFVFQDSAYFSIVKQAMGYSIYGLSVPINGQEVYLTSKGNLTLNINQTSQQYDIVNIRILLGQVTYSKIIVQLYMIMSIFLLF